VLPDLKPSNVLVTRDGTVKLLDFRFVKLLDEERAPGDSYGKVPSTGAVLKLAA